ncbi:hypothetical protein DRE_06224 [Drechslerella stenobrocha 248]|uniref:Small ribosomal subunit protein uS10m n=1 Tax=Drechslerella stenobrocha 248 TaxID=1043628 RepID=W7I7Y0_9PEZI|nr:hypothetical protein DRE_06224 [Drechslerella stenobrocha 248]
MLRRLAASTVRSRRYISTQAVRYQALEPLPASEPPSFAPAKWGQVYDKEFDDSKAQDAPVPLAVRAMYHAPLKVPAEFNVPSCDLQIRSFNLKNVEFFADFALRAAYYLKLPAAGPVPLPRRTERWTVPKSNFVHKKSQQNFERVTYRRLVQIKDAHPDVVQVWLGFLRKHEYYGIGMKANVYTFEKLGTGSHFAEKLSAIKERADAGKADHNQQLSAMQKAFRAGHALPAQKTKGSPERQREIKFAAKYDRLQKGTRSVATELNKIAREMNIAFEYRKSKKHARQEAGLELLNRIRSQRLEWDKLAGRSRRLAKTIRSMREIETNANSIASELKKGRKQLQPKPQLPKQVTRESTRKFREAGNALVSSSRKIRALHKQIASFAKDRSGPHPRAVEEAFRASHKDILGLGDLISEVKLQKIPTGDTPSSTKENSPVELEGHPEVMAEEQKAEPSGATPPPQPTESEEIVAADSDPVPPPAQEAANAEEVKGAKEIQINNPAEENKNRLPTATAHPSRIQISCAQTRLLSTTPPTQPEVVFSGIQPTGVPHLGNYLGALKHWVGIQDAAPPESTLLYCVVDLHAITQPQIPDDLRRRRRETLAMLLAIGLRPERCVIFEQSKVPAHAMLMWILSTLAPTNLLARQTQWKTKLAASEERSPLDPDGVSKLKLGLFSYPVLQAADILLYKTTSVPVGEDQVQHLELARNLAGKFNRAFGKTFAIPQVKLAPAKRVMSLNSPTTKMSKSGPANSQINLDHSEDEIRKRIKTAITDSISGITYDPENRPGVSNLVEILGNMTDRSDWEAVARECEGLSMKEFKERVADSLVEGLAGIRKEYTRIVAGDESYLDDLAKSGAEKANMMADETMQTVMRAIGMR